MATATKTTAPKNVYQKLIEARQTFLESDAKQSGKNMNLSFKYFELKDIVPTITSIFVEKGLIALDNFSPDIATLTIVNTENPEETIAFSAPFNQITPIVSNTGKQVTNDMQALGSSITYMRRYLYLIAMDICVNDDIEPSINKDPNSSIPVQTQTEHKVPATPEQRQEVKENLTAPAGNASALQIKGLKAALKKLKDVDPSKEELIECIAVQTKGFTEISKTDCEKLIQWITAKLDTKEENDG